MTSGSHWLPLALAVLGIALPAAGLQGQEPGNADAPSERAQQGEISGPPAAISPEALGGEQAPPGPAQAAASPPGASALPALQLQALNATRERPLFRADRRPPAPPPPPDQAAPAAETAIAPPPPLDFELMGVVSMSSGSVAILSQAGLPAPLRSKVGDVLNGWTLKSIEPRAAIFENNGEERRLSLSGSSIEWGEDEKGVRSVTIGAAAGAAPQSSPDQSQGVVKADGAVPSDTTKEVEPPPAQDENPRQVRKVY